MKSIIPLATVRNELSRRKAVQYLRARGIYRGDQHCDHEYEPHNPDALRDMSVTVTVLCLPKATLNVSTRGA